MFHDLIPLFKFLAKVIFFTFLTKAILKTYESIPFGGSVTIVFIAVAMVYAFVPDLMRFFAWIPRRARYDAYKHWMGRYFAFRNRPVKFYTDEEGEIWVMVKHISPLLSPRISEGEIEIAKHANMVLETKAGKLIKHTSLDQMMQRRLAKLAPDHQQVLVHRWLNTEVYPNIRRRPSTSFEV